MSEAPEETDFENLSEEQKQRALRFKEQLSQAEEQEAREHSASADGFQEWLASRFPPTMVQQLVELGPAVVHYLMHMVR